MAECLTPTAIDRDEWVVPYLQDVKYYVRLMMVKRIGWMAQLGITEDDLFQGAMVRLFQLKRRIDNGAYKKELAPEYTWVKNQIKYGLEDEIRRYSWSNSNMIRHQVRQVKHNEPVIQFLLVQLCDSLPCDKDAGTEHDMQIQHAHVESTECDVIGIIHTMQQTKIATERIQQYSVRKQHVLREYFGANRSLKDIGKDLAVTESRVCSLIKEILKDLRIYIGKSQVGRKLMRVRMNTQQADMPVHHHNRSEPARDMFINRREVCYV